MYPRTETLQSRVCFVRKVSDGKQFDSTGANADRIIVPLKNHWLELELTFELHDHHKVTKSSVALFNHSEADDSTDCSS